MPSKLQTRATTGGSTTLSGRAGVALYGSILAGAVAAMVGSYTCKRFGRRLTMCAGGFAFLAGTALVASAYAVAQLVAEHRMEEWEAAELAADLSYNLAKAAYRL